MKINKKDNPLEKGVVKSIMNYLDKYYPGFYFKTHGGPYQRAGIPDILGVYKGKFIGIEVKRPSTKGNLSALQKLTLAQIKAAGGIAFSCYDIPSLKRNLKEYIKKED